MRPNLFRCGFKPKCLPTWTLRLVVPWYDMTRPHWLQRTWVSESLVQKRHTSDTMVLYRGYVPRARRALLSAWCWSAQSPGNSCWCSATVAPRSASPGTSGTCTSWRWGRAPRATSLPSSQGPWRLSSADYSQSPSHAQNFLRTITQAHIDWFTVAECVILTSHHCPPSKREVCVLPPRGDTHRICFEPSQTPRLQTLPVDSSVYAFLYAVLVPPIHHSGLALRCYRVLQPLHAIDARKLDERANSFLVFCVCARTQQFQF